MRLLMRTLTTALIGLLVTSLLLFALAPGASASPDPTCVPTSGGMDYHSFLCVDGSDPKCPVYTLQHTHNEIEKKCVGEL